MDTRPRHDGPGVTGSSSTTCSGTRTSRARAPWPSKTLSGFDSSEFASGPRVVSPECRGLPSPRGAAWDARAEPRPPRGWPAAHRHRPNSPIPRRTRPRPRRCSRAAASARERTARVGGCRGAAIAPRATARLPTRRVPAQPARRPRAPGQSGLYLVGRPLATDPLAEPRAAALVAGPRARWPSRSCAGKSKSTQLTVAGLTAGVGEPPQTGVGREFVRKPGQAAAASGDGALGAGRRLGRAAGRVGRCGSGR
jgi:hypothetical protein